MLIRSIHLANKAKQANIDENVLDENMEYPSRFHKKWPHLANNCDEDVMYLGGGQEVPKQDICSKLMGKKTKKAIDPEERWLKMTKLEKEERVE